MAMTAEDMLKLKEGFVSLDDYQKDKDACDRRFTAVETRVKCSEDKQIESDKIVVRIDTQLKIIIWLNVTLLAAVITAIVKLIIS